MQQANQNLNQDMYDGDYAQQQNLARVVRIKPGTSSEKSVKVILPEELYDASVDKVLGYVMGEDLKRKDERIAERIKNEMKGQYGMTINASPAKGDEMIKGYFVQRETPNGIQYLEAEIIIAAKQEGGLERRL